MLWLTRVAVVALFLVSLAFAAPDISSNVPTAEALPPSDGIDDPLPTEHMAAPKHQLSASELAEQHDKAMTQLEAIGSDDATALRSSLAAAAKSDSDSSDSSSDDSSIQGTGTEAFLDAGEDADEKQNESDLEKEDRIAIDAVKKMGVDNPENEHEDEEQEDEEEHDGEHHEAGDWEEVEGDEDESEDESEHATMKREAAQELVTKQENDAAKHQLLLSTQKGFFPIVAGPFQPIRNVVGAAQTLGRLIIPKQEDQNKKRIEAMMKYAAKIRLENALNKLEQADARRSAVARALATIKQCPSFPLAGKKLAIVNELLRAVRRRLRMEARGIATGRCDVRAGRSLPTGKPKQILKQLQVEEAQQNNINTIQDGLNRQAPDNKVDVRLNWLHNNKEIAGNLRLDNQGGGAAGAAVKFANGANVNGGVAWNANGQRAANVGTGFKIGGVQVNANAMFPFLVASDEKLKTAYKPDEDEDETDDYDHEVAASDDEDSDDDDEDDDKSAKSVFAQADSAYWHSRNKQREQQQSDASDESDDDEEDNEDDEENDNEDDEENSSDKQKNTDSPVSDILIALRNTKGDSLDARAQRKMLRRAAADEVLRMARSDEPDLLIGSTKGFRPPPPPPPPPAAAPPPPPPQPPKQPEFPDNPMKLEEYFKKIQRALMRRVELSKHANCMLIHVSNLLRALKGQKPIKAGCSGVDPEELDRMKKCTSLHIGRYVRLVNKMMLLNKAQKHLQCACKIPGNDCEYFKNPRHNFAKDVDKIVGPLSNTAKGLDNQIGRLRAMVAQHQRKLADLMKKLNTEKKVAKKDRRRGKKRARKMRRGERKKLRKDKKSRRKQRKQARKDRRKARTRRRKEKYTISDKDFAEIMSPIEKPQKHGPHPFWAMLAAIKQITLPMAKRAHLCAISPLLCTGPESGAYPGLASETPNPQDVSAMRLQDIMPHWTPQQTMNAHAALLAQHIGNILTPPTPVYLQTMQQQQQQQPQQGQTLSVPPPAAAPVN